MSILSVVVGLIAVVLLWAVVVGAYYAITLVSACLASRLFKLTGRRLRE